MKNFNIKLAVVNESRAYEALSLGNIEQAEDFLLASVDLQKEVDAELIMSSTVELLEAVQQASLKQA